MLYAGFDTPNRMPAFWVDFEKIRSGKLTADTHQPSASAGSLSMEFTRLSQLTGDPKYHNAISRVTNLLYETQNATLLPGMWPTFFDMSEGILTQDNTFTLGALADSLYEYLVKMHALLGGAEPKYAAMYLAAAETIEKNLLYRPMTPNGDDILFTGTFHVDDPVHWLDSEGQHLACFAGGMFALGGRLFNSQKHIDIGIKLTRGCIWAYKAFPTGIMPEIFSIVACDSLTPCKWDQEKWERKSHRTTKGTYHYRKGFGMLEYLLTAYVRRRLRVHSCCIGLLGLKNSSPRHGICSRPSRLLLVRHMVTLPLTMSPSTVDHHSRILWK